MADADALFEQAATELRRNHVVAARHCSSPRVGSFAAGPATRAGEDGRRSSTA